MLPASRDPPIRPRTCHNDSRRTVFGSASWALEEDGAGGDAESGDDDGDELFGDDPDAPAQSKPLDMANPTVDGGEDSVRGDMEEIIAQDEISEEAHRHRTAPDPGKPTPKQLEDHRLTHCPFRAWCPWCVMGRGRGQKHRMGKPHSMPIIGID